MVEDPVRRYLDAKTELDQALSRVGQLELVISKVAKNLHDSPYAFMVSNVDVGFPIEVGGGGARFTLNSKEWPSAKEIAEALANMHKCHNNALNLYSRLPEADRKNVAPLPPKRM